VKCFSSGDQYLLFDDVMMAGALATSQLDVGGRIFGVLRCFAVASIQIACVSIETACVSCVAIFLLELQAR
jgi:hypothetical protein